MSELNQRSEPSGAPRQEAEMGQDLQALRKLTVQGLPEVEQVLNQVRTRRPIERAGGSLCGPA